jgi:Histone deacetylase domain
MQSVRLMQLCRYHAGKSCMCAFQCWLVALACNASTLKHVHCVTGVGNAGGTHHAFADRGEGFCVFNDIAVSAQWALSERGLKRILVIDVGAIQFVLQWVQCSRIQSICDDSVPW